MLTSYSVNPGSPFLENACAFCKAGFEVGDEIVICPEDGARHHASCWEANENHCSAFGCTGAGEVGRDTIVAPVEGAVIEGGRTDYGRSDFRRSAYGRSKVRTMPQVRFGCGRGCCFLFLLLSLLLVGATCFGLWTFTDFITQWISQFTAASGLVPPDLISLIA